MIPPRDEYERFIYSIVRDFQNVEKSSLHFYSTSAAAGMLKGMVWFRNGLILKVVEVIDFAARYQKESKTSQGYKLPSYQSANAL